MASEVRSLAQRSAKAAREITMLITGSVENVESGSLVVLGAGDVTHELAGNANRMNDRLSEISTASSDAEQGRGAGGCGGHRKDHRTQQNAALVERTAAAALKDQAIGLASELASFRLPAHAAP